MNKKHILRITIILCLLLAVIYCFSNKHIHYSYKLNHVSTLKYLESSEKINAYKAITLTPVAYHSTILSSSITAKAIYKKDTIGIQIVNPKWQNKLEFRSIGAESNAFVQALSALYEEPAGKGIMKPVIESTFLIGDNSTAWSSQPASYKTAIKLTGNKTAEMYITIDIPNHIIQIGDKNNGLSKQNFVDAFEEN